MVPADVTLDGIVGQLDFVGVLSRRTKLRDRPMAGKAAMAKPATHVPPQTPARHAEGQCGFGAEGLPPTLACGVWTAPQTVDDVRRPLQGPEMMIAMIANVPGQCANRTCAVLAIEMYALEDSPSRPTIRHGRAILVLKSIDV